MVRLFLCLKGGVDMKNEYKFSDDKKICTIFLLTELLLLLMQTILNLFQNTRGSGAKEDILPHTSAEKQKQQAEPLHFIDFFLDFLKMLILIILTGIK